MSNFGHGGYQWRVLGSPPWSSLITLLFIILKSKSWLIDLSIDWLLLTISSCGWILNSIRGNYNLTFGGTFAGGFLSFKPSIPKSLLLSGEHNVESHFTLINHQVYTYRLDPIHICIWWNFDVALCNICCTWFFSFQIKQIRTALAIASLLNRTLVRTNFGDHTF